MCIQSCIDVSEGASFATKSGLVSAHCRSCGTKPREALSRSAVMHRDTQPHAHAHPHYQRPASYRDFKVRHRDLVACDIMSREEATLKVEPQDQGEWHDCAHSGRALKFGGGIE